MVYYDDFRKAWRTIAIKYIKGRARLLDMSNTWDSSTSTSSQQPDLKKQESTDTFDESANSSPTAKTEKQEHSILDYFSPVKSTYSNSETNTETSKEKQTTNKGKDNKMADTDSHQLHIQDDTQSQQGGEESKQQGGEESKEFEKKVAEERKQVGEGEEATDEEMDKVEKRLVHIIESALESIRPWLKMMIERCEEAEHKQRNNTDFDEKAFVESMKPIIKQAQDILEATLDQVKAVDPEQKVQRRAKRNAEDEKASPNQRTIADGLSKLSGEVQKTIEECKKKVKNMPMAKSELGNMFGMLSRPLFQIISAVGLLVYGVLNLLGEILDTLGLGGLFRGLMEGLGLNKLLNSLGWKVQLVKTGNKE